MCKIMLFLMMLLLLGYALTCAAEPIFQPQTRDISVMHYRLNSMLPAWSQDDAFYQTLDYPLESLHIDHLSRQTDLELNNALMQFSRRMRFAFSPQFVIKPFIAIEEVKDMLTFYQYRVQSRQIQITQNFEAKTALSGEIISLKKARANRIFALSPCQKRVYGLHLRINFK